MEKLKMTRYYTMNSWNISTAPAFNLKVYNVIPEELQNKVYELRECAEFYNNITLLIRAFNIEHNYIWQAGFNGRSGGYLVLYKGGKKANGQIFTYPGKHIDNEEVPAEVLKSFKQLARDIVTESIHMAKAFDVAEESYTIEKTRKVLHEKY
jgi:hypothetical protein